MSKTLRTIFLFSFAFAGPFLLSKIIPYSDFSASAYAEEEKKERKYANVKTRRRDAVGKKCIPKLEKVNEVIEEENWAKALEKIKEIEESSKTCKSAFEQSTLWRIKGIVYFSADDIGGAIHSFEQVINGEGTPYDLRLDTRYTVAQLYIMQERFAESAVQLEIWIEESTIVSSAAYALLASNYYQLDRKDEALKYIDLAIDGFESKGKIPRERWWTLQRQLYYEKNEHNKVIDILEKLVKHYPKWIFWRQLGGMYAEQERDIDQLVAYDLVYMNGELNKESQLMRLAYMYIGAGVPYKAAQIIAQGLDGEIIERSAKNLELLGKAWFQAKDLKLSLSAFDEASKYSDSGEIQSRMAGVYLDLGKDKQAYQAAVKAADKGNVKRPSSNYLIMGNALVNMHCYKDAIGAFQKAIKVAEDEKEKRFPKQWIKYADVEGTRLGKLRDLGAEVPSCRK